jgi:hypothetical protein
MDFKYDGDFSERDIPLIYEEHTGARTDIRVLKRYNTNNGYLALVHMYKKYYLFFVHKRYITLEVVELISGNVDLGAAQNTEDIAKIIGAEEIAKETTGE